MASRTLTLSVHSKQLERHSGVICWLKHFMKAWLADHWWVHFPMRSFFIFTVCNSWFQTLVGNQNSLLLYIKTNPTTAKPPKHVTLRSYRANSGSKQPMQRAHWGGQKLGAMSWSVEAPVAVSPLKC